MDLERIVSWLKENIKWIGIGISVVLLLVLAVLLIDNKQELNRQKKREAELQEKISPYQTEINDIQNEIALKKRELEESQGNSAVGITFVVSSVKEAEKTKSLTEGGSKPVSILLNDSMNLKEVKEVLAVLDVRSYDMILTGSRLMDEGWEKVDETKKLLKKAGYQKQPAFLLLIKEDEEENLKSLKERGYTTILRYRKELDSGKTKWEQNFFPYSIIKEKGVTESRVNQLEKKSANMFFLFHVGAIEEGLITEQEMAEALEVLRDEETEGKIQIMDLSEMTTVLQEQQEKTDVQQQEFEAYEAEQNEKIDELERAIEEIYAE